MSARSGSSFQVRQCCGRRGDTCQQPRLVWTGHAVGKRADSWRWCERKYIGGTRITGPILWHQTGSTKRPGTQRYLQDEPDVSAASSGRTSNEWKTTKHVSRRNTKSALMHSPVLILANSISCLELDEGNPIGGDGIASCASIFSLKERDPQPLHVNRAPTNR
jgi:hypothetical protein